VILVGTQDHCLHDLLARWKSGELDVDVPCVVSNHEALRDLVEWHGIPFRHVPARALRHHLQDRVLVHGHKTVVFS
jgi:formyltetrahydrofolate deformylase